MTARCEAREQPPMGAVIKDAVQARASSQAVKLPVPRGMMRRTIWPACGEGG
jgi:hypothetical protein